MIHHAAKEASKSTFKYRLGAVITKGGRVLGQGHNEVGRYTKSNPHPYKDSIHAEVHAILDALRRGKGSIPTGASLWVTRIGNSGLRSSSPCSYCRLFALANGIKKVIYTTNDGEIKHERL